MKTNYIKSGGVTLEQVVGDEGEVISMTVTKGVTEPKVKVQLTKNWEPVESTSEGKPASKHFDNLQTYFRAQGEVSAPDVYNIFGVGARSWVQYLVRKEQVRQIGKCPTRWKWVGGAS